MGYCILDDIKKLIPTETIIQLTDDENTGAIVESRVNEAIVQADAEIDSYCGSRYTVPFTTVPDIVKKLSVDIAIYNLYSRRVEAIPDVRGERYKNAIRQLEGISKGVVSIGEQPEPAKPADSGASSNKTAADRIFTKDSMKGF